MEAGNYSKEAEGTRRKEAEYPLLVGSFIPHTLSSYNLVAGWVGIGTGMQGCVPQVAQDLLFSRTESSRLTDCNKVDIPV